MGRAHPVGSGPVRSLQGTLGLDHPRPGGRRDRGAAADGPGRRPDRERPRDAHGGARLCPRIAAPGIVTEPWLAPVALARPRCEQRRDGRLDERTRRGRGTGAARPIMSSLHAGWSVGGLCRRRPGGRRRRGRPGARGSRPFGAAAGGAARRRVPAPARRRVGRVESRTGFVRAWRGVIVLGILCFLIMLAEGAVADWGGLYLSQNLGTSTAAAALAFAAFAAGMTGGRMVGDRLNRRLGAAMLMRAGSALAAVALGALLLAGDCRRCDRRLRPGRARARQRRAARVQRGRSRARTRVGAEHRRGQLHGLARLPRRPAVHRLPRRGDLAAARALDALWRAHRRHPGRPRNRHRSSPVVARPPIRSERSAVRSR